MIDLIGYWVSTTIMTYALLVWPLFIGMVLTFSGITYVRSSDSYTKQFSKWFEGAANWWSVPITIVSTIALGVTAFFWFFVGVEASVAAAKDVPTKFGIEWMQGFIHSGSIFFGPAIGWLGVVTLSIVGSLKGMRLLYRMNQKVQKLMSKETSDD
jgi:hypothetical protein